MKEYSSAISNPPAGNRKRRRSEPLEFVSDLLRASVILMCSGLIFYLLALNLPESMALLLEGIVPGIKIMTNSAADPFLDRDVLPTNVKPVHYNVHLEPNLETFKFKGHVDVDLKVLKNTREIALNSVQLDFEKAVLTCEGQTISLSSQRYNEKLETMSLVFDRELTAGTDCQLSIDYIGIHNDKMAGFYRSAYKDAVTGKDKYLVVTQFEPTDARKAFPCWDEPALKATFDVTLVIPSHMTGLSNMDDISTTDLGNGLKEVKFARSPIMSTYLVAFLVGELDYVETHTSDESHTLVRVFAPTGLAKQGEFAMNVAVKVLEFFGDYFGEPYPLPKMDMCAIPDFAAGAMENWGLVTYRTVMLLFDEKSSSARSKQQIAYVVGHELAHQWFGNLVSPGWWSDLWLNEGFATWAGWLATDHIFPEWEIWTQFVNDDLQRGLVLDALRSSHPIEVPVKNPSEIHQIFDAISYSKGASVIRMLANYLGTEDFRQGVRNYLQAFKYRNADTKDLWEHLSEAAGHKPVAKLMNSWTRQTGFPVVSVVSSPADGEGALKVRQERFLSSGDLKSGEDEATWFIPLQIVSSFQPRLPSTDVLSAKEGIVHLKDVKVGSLGQKEFYKLNSEQSGFFRTKYEPALLAKIGEAIKDGRLGSSDRIGILTDTHALARSGHGSTIQTLELLKNFEDEKNYIVWNELASILGSLRSVWWEAPAEVSDGLKSVTRRMFSKIAKELGWEYGDEGFLTHMLRTLAITSAGKAGDAEIVSEAQVRFKKFTAGDESAINPNLRGTVFSIVLQNGGVEEYEAVLRLYRETRVADQKLVALTSLGSAKDEELLKRTLKFAISEEVRAQDIIYILNSVGSNFSGRRLLWEFVKENWQTFYDRYYTGSMSLLSRVVTYSTESFSSDKWYADVEGFFKDKDLPNISRSIQQSLEKISANAKWYERDSAAIADWLKNNTTA